MPLEDPNFLNPDITLSGICHTCQEQILLSQENCPHCGIELIHEDLVPSVINHFVINQAISSANAILTFDVAAYIFIGVSVMGALIGLPRWLMIPISVIWVMPLVLIIRWFRRHGKWDTKDEDYQSKYQQLKSSLKLWLVCHVINIALIIVTEPIKFT